MVKPRKETREGVRLACQGDVSGQLDNSIRFPKGTKNSATGHCWSGSAAQRNEGPVLGWRVCLTYAGAHGDHMWLSDALELDSGWF